VLRVVSEQGKRHLIEAVTIPPGGRGTGRR
jgi:hypothetical protein